MEKLYLFYFLPTFLVPISKELAKMAFCYYPIYYRLKKHKSIKKVNWYANVESVNRLPSAYQYFLEQKNFDKPFFYQKLLEYYGKPKH
jgi:hypothetical protein